MYKVFKEAEFSAAHSLRGYKGRCESMHGHNWQVRLQIRAIDTDSLGMVVDFEEIKQALAKVIGKLDHQNLNEIPPFNELNPTSENIAKHIFEEASGLLNTDRVKVDSVMVWEKQSSCAVYEAD